MAKLVCEVCGCGNLLKCGDYFHYEICGAKYSIEKTRELLGNERRKEYVHECSKAHEEMDTTLQNVIYFIA